ncbi:MAG: ParB/RepB/Spo0J family partition protein [Bacteroidota bacterium]
MNTNKKPPRKSALGRGLNALLKDSPFLSEKEGSNPIQEIPVEQIQVNPFQPRKDFDATALQELSESIRLHGIIQPLTVRQLAPSSYQLIAGERRLQAAKLAHLQQVPVYIRRADDQQMLEMALIENIQRENLNPIEIALSYQRLLTECQIKQETLGDRVGKNRTTVNNYLRLLKLPPDIQIALRDQKISMGHARALINVEAVEAQLGLFQEIIDKDLSVRNVEALVRALSQSKAPPTAPAKKVATKLKHTAKEASTQLATRLKTPVKIKVSNQETGEIKIAFTNAQELDRILKILGGK